MTQNTFVNFSVKVILLFLVIFGIHLGVLKGLDMPLWAHYIIASYSINLGLVVIIFGALYFLRKKYKEQLGFLFLFGSLLKFAVFFIFFYPIYKADGAISRAEFATFFIPYAVGLIFETLSLGKWLNKLD